MKNGTLIYVAFLTLFICVKGNSAVIHVSLAATGLNNGTSWSNAFSSLQLAIETAQEGDEIWVASGDYFPSTRYGGISNRNMTFFINKEIKIYGGFVGNEQFLETRDFKSNQTILNGDIGVMNDSTDNTYHVVWIENVGPLMEINGFIIKNGNADDAFVNNGGGIFCNINNISGYCNPSIVNCTISNNFARFGGGIFNNGSGGLNSSPIILQCVFTNNCAYQGGGIFSNAYSNGNSSPLIKNSYFISNRALEGNFVWAGKGGAIYFNGGNGGKIFSIIKNCYFFDNIAKRGGGIYGLGDSGGICSPVIDSCTFENNHAVEKGAGIFNDATFSGNNYPVVKNSLFKNNKANNGAGIFNNSYFASASSPKINNCIFQANSSIYGAAISELAELSFPFPQLIIDCEFINNEAVYGGCLYNDLLDVASSSDSLINCSFLNNSADYGGAIFNQGKKNNFHGSNIIRCKFSGNSSSGNGGAISSNNCILYLSNSLITGNYSTEFGGGIYNKSSFLEMINCSFSGNYAKGGGAIQTDSSKINIKNSIFWGDNQEINSNASTTGFLSNCIVEGGCTSGFNCTDVLNLNPFYTMQPDWNNAPSDVANLHLNKESIAIDLGLDIITDDIFDLDGNPRKIDAILAGNIIDLGCYEYQSIITSVNDFPKNKYFLTIHPNPARNEITIRFKDYIQESSKIEIYDIKGRILQTFHLEKDYAEIKIDLSKFNENSIFIIKITTRNQFFIEKIIRF